MPDGQFFLRVHLAKCHLVPVCNKDRIISESVMAARRPDKLTIDPAFKNRLVAIWPDQSQNADEMGAAIIALHRGKRAVYLLHGQNEVLVWSSPARRINTGRTIQGRNHQPGIIGKGRLACGNGGGTGFQQGIA